MEEEVAALVRIFPVLLPESIPKSRFLRLLIMVPACARLAVRVLSSFFCRNIWPFFHPFDSCWYVDLSITSILRYWLVSRWRCTSCRFPVSLQSIQTIKAYPRLVPLSVALVTRVWWWEWVRRILTSGTSQSLCGGQVVIWASSQRWGTIKAWNSDSQVPHRTRYRH